ncbi:MAG: toll/interleukin-1 receptor domain-containing protein [Oscillospiraceae bacterium]|nr:toll/interleukin-1 receptor domain-containing protein [Oscillospiraceae bacterium]
MKLFISWSGEFSKKVAERLSIWIPTIIQSVNVFYSPDDIAKGENWSNHLDKELKESSFGVICLTPENVTAPWIHFEAGALAKSLDTRISAILLGVNPSEVQGPLSRYQNTVFEKEDFYKLFLSIDEASENRLKPSILRNAFDNAWDKLYAEISQIISIYPTSPTEEPVERDANSDAIQEILRLVRRMDNNSPAGNEIIKTVYTPPSTALTNTDAIVSVMVSAQSDCVEEAISIIDRYITPGIDRSLAYRVLRGSGSCYCIIYQSALETVRQQLSAIGASITLK